MNAVPTPAQVPAPTTTVASTAHAPPAAPANAPAALPSRTARVAGGLVIAVVVLGLVGVLVYVIFFRPPPEDPHKKEDRNRPLPVVITTTRRGDVPIYLDSLGTVTALNTVTLRSRVDGEVTKVLYTEGQVVKQGDLLVEIDPRAYQAALQQAQGQLAKDQAMLQNAQADADRYNAARETVSQQQIDNAAASVAEFQGAIKVDQGAIANANLQLQFCRITAPLTGKIGLRAVDVGNVVHTGDTTGLATLTQIDPIAVVFNLPEVNLPSVIEAQHESGALTADVFNADRSKLLASGDLSAIDNQIDVTTATVRIKAVFPNPGGLLYPNQFANVRLRLRTLKQAIVVPNAAVQRSPDTAFVYVAKADDTAELRPVTVGPEEGGRTVIETGLATDEKVVVDGFDKLAPGMSIKPRDLSVRPTTAPATSPVAASESKRGGRS